MVGDIHGHFKFLTMALDKLDFNTELDRIFSVGDLIDRGPDSIDVLNWLEKPWFHAVRGNHEQMLIDCISGHGDIPDISEMVEPGCTSYNPPSSMNSQNPCKHFH